jgi:hypothetical protein
MKCANPQCDNDAKVRGLCIRRYARARAEPAIAAMMNPNPPDERNDEPRPVAAENHPHPALLTAR